MGNHKLQLSNPNELRILAFGDSLVEGYTDFGTPFHPYAIKLRKKLSQLLPNFKMAVDVNGESGDCVLPSLQGIFLQRLQSSCPIRTQQPPKYDLVIILGGTNDLAFLINDPNGPNQIFEGLKVCYEHILKTGASLLCLTVPERALDTRNSALGRKAKEARLALNEKIVDFVKLSQEGGENEAGVTGDEAGAAADATGKVFMMDLAAMVPFQPDQKEDEDFKSDIWSPDGLHMSSQGYDFVGLQLATLIHGMV
ncbi:SGNH hydrolase [Zopfia rhizophila CBS 207.26]|uniref:SGNH hydrolase n=1 Tax=Zopfia rhizophila CBS 207.26 TaxID=1314779 RepID=A0A6A6EHQ0_9PEZI|nr:SGNH hydrolase [Zopfia rhizophila CBS 207.26]